MSTSDKNLPKSRFLSKHFSLRFKRNNGGLTKSNSCRSYRNVDKESYLNVSNVSGRYVLTDESTEPPDQRLSNETRDTANRGSALVWARRKISQFRESIRKRNTGVFKVEQCQEHDDSQEYVDSIGAYATTEDCYPGDGAGCDENLYSRKISPNKSVSADNIHQSSRLQRIGQRFFIVRWMTTKILQFRERHTNTPRGSRSVYEKARAIFDISDDSMTSSNAEDPVYMDASLTTEDPMYMDASLAADDPLYMDASLADVKEPSAMSNAEPARESMVYFELEPDQRYEIVTLDSTSKPVLSGDAAKPSQYAKLGEHNKSERGNIYGDLSSAPLEDFKEKT